MKGEFVICDECKTKIATVRCKYCGKDLCREDRHKFSLNIEKNGDRNCIVINPSSYQDKYLSVCSECSSRIDNVIGKLKEKDLEFVLEKLWEHILELAELEAL